MRRGLFWTFGCRKNAEVFLNRKSEGFSCARSVPRTKVCGLSDTSKDKQLFEKTGVYGKQTAVEVVEKGVQTGVQTGSFYEIFKNLSLNERALLFTLMNSEMKLSYEDLALLLGKERSTVRGQINAIKQKSEGLIEEITEKNGKKRVYVPLEIKEKLAKYAKVRVVKRKKGSVNTKIGENNE